MSDTLDLEAYLSEGVRQIVKGALRASGGNNRTRAFLLRYSISCARAAKIRRRWEKKGEHVPAFLIASIETRCNLFCQGCYSRAGGGCSEDRKEDLLKPEEWDRLFTEAESLGISFILLAGGEPLFNRDILEKASAHKAILFPVFTNGTLFDDAYFAFFDRHRNMVPVVSLEGNEADTDARRGAGTYKKAHTSMERFNEYGMMYGVSLTVTAQNAEKVLEEAFLEYLSHMGCRIVFYVEYVPADGKSAELAPGEQERELLDKGIAKARKKYDKMLFISFPGDEKLSGGCLAAGRGFFHITAAGSAEPCPFAPYSDKNIKNATLLEIMHSPLFEALKKEGYLELNHKGGCALFDKKEIRQLACEEPVG